MFEVLEDGGHLLGEFAGRCEDNGEQFSVAAFEVAAVSELLDNGEGEGEGLS